MRSPPANADRPARSDRDLPREAQWQNSVPGYRGRHHEERPSRHPARLHRARDRKVPHRSPPRPVRSFHRHGAGSKSHHPADGAALGSTAPGKPQSMLRQDGAIELMLATVRAGRLRNPLAPAPWSSDSGRITPFRPSLRQVQDTDKLTPGVGRAQLVRYAEQVRQRRGSLPEARLPPVAVGAWPPGLDNVMFQSIRLNVRVGHREGELHTIPEVTQCSTQYRIGLVAQQKVQQAVPDAGLRLAHVDAFITGRPARWHPKSVHAFQALRQRAHHTGTVRLTLSLQSVFQGKRRHQAHQTSTCRGKVECPCPSVGNDSNLVSSGRRGILTVFHNTGPGCR